MAMGSFEYLKRYVSRESPPTRNWFTPVTEDEIRAAEQRVGSSFPAALRQFYLEVGSGFLRASEGDKKVTTNVNRNLDPAEAAALRLGEAEASAPPEGFEDGDLPIFEVGDQLFLVMKPATTRPDAVYWMYGEEVAPSFEDFVRRLYFEDPDYFRQM